MTGSPVLKWIALALLGLAIAGGVALAASRLASQQIGIASESVSAGDALAPAFKSPRQGAAPGGGEGGGRRQEERKAPVEPVTPVAPTTTVPAEPPASEPAPGPEGSSPPRRPGGEGDHGGSGGGGRGAGDD